MRNQVEKSSHNPLGPAYNPAVVEQQQRAARERLGQQEAQAFREGAYDVNKLNYARDAAVAGMERPVLSQTGGTSTGTGTIKQEESPWGAILQTGASLAPMSL